MIRSTFRIPLDLYDTASQASIRIVKGDTSRRIIFNLVEEGRPYALTKECYAVFAATKPDGTNIYNDTVNCLETVVYDVTSQTVSAEGTVHCQLWIYGKDGQYIASPLFTILVTQKVFDDSTLESTNEYTSLHRLVEEASGIIEAEEGRVEAEKTRVQNENTRIANENTRTANEQTRTSTETTRISNESKREQAYTKATEAETARASAEAVRIQNEDTRIANEAERERAVSELLTQSTAAQLSSRVDRHDKRITNLEQGIPSDPFYTDSSVVYTKNVPSNALPYAEVERLGGATRKCTNLFDESQITHATTGAGVTSEAYGVVQNGELIAKMGLYDYGIIWKPFAMSLGAGTYTISADCYISTGGAPNLNLSVRLFNTKTNASVSASGVSLSSFDKWERISAQIALTEPSEYMLSVQGGGTADLSSNMDVRFKNICVAEGDVAEYIPYFDGLRSAKVTEVESVGVNLLNPDWRKSETINGVTFTKNADGSVTANGTATGDIVYHMALDTIGGGDMIEPNTTYYASLGNGFVNTAQKVLAIGTTLSGKISYHVWANSRVFTTPAEFDSVLVRIRAYAGEVFSNEVLYPIIAKSSVAVPYSPYVKNTLAIPEAVQALDGYGEGLDSNNFNSVEWSEDGKRVFNRRVKTVELDGSEEWYIAGGTFWTHINDSKKPQGAVLSSRYTCTIIDVLYVSVASTGVSTVDEFKAALRADPFYVTYIIDTPEIVDVSDVLPADNFIDIEGNGTLTFKNEYGYEVPSEITYMLKEA